MTNSIALQLEKERFGNGRRKRNNTKSLISLFSEVKRIANDSLFFFGIFFVAITALQFLPTLTGLINEMNIGINEVAVSLLGFVNIFFLQIFSKVLKKNN